MQNKFIQKTMSVVPSLDLSIPARDACTGTDALKIRNAATISLTWTSVGHVLPDADAL